MTPEVSRETSRVSNAEWATAAQVAATCGGTFANDDPTQVAVRNLARVRVNGIDALRIVAAVTFQTLTAVFGPMVGANYAYQFGWREGSNRAIAVPEFVVVVRRIFADVESPIARAQLSAALVGWGLSGMKPAWLTIPEPGSPTRKADLLAALHPNLLAETRRCSEPSGLAVVALR